MSSDIIRVHHEDFLAIGRKLFGDDRNEWKFECCSCHHVQSENSMRANNPSIQRPPIPYYCCEGRYTNGFGCNWTLGGLLKLHTVEIFWEGCLRPSFMFAHPEAEALLREAATRCPVPQHPTTTATSWEEYDWPEWVPEKVRQRIQEFWCPSFHRSPKDWLDDAQRQGAPVLGSVCTLERAGSTDTATGRYIHCWNNIGRIVDDEGTLHYVSF